MKYFFRNVFSLILAVLLICGLCSCTSESEDSSSDISELSVGSVEESLDIEPEIDSDIEIDLSEIFSEPEDVSHEEYFKDIPYVGIYVADTLEECYSENPNEHIYPASLTKMVTASVALKYGSIDDIYTVGTELDLVQPHSSLFGIRKGMSISLEHLLYGLLLPSGNDAAYTIAVNVVRGISGNENLSDREAVDYFCQLMNEHCQEIGAYDSHFTTPEGWDDENQYTTVKDLACIASYAMNNFIISEIVSTPQIKFLVASGETFNISNSNLLIHESSEYYLPECTGLKTGTTDLAGACLVASVVINETDYILIAAGCPTNTSRFETVRELFTLVQNYDYASKIEPPVLLPQ